MPAYINDTCTNCKLCEAVCPTKSIFAGKRHYVVDTDTCLGTGLCVVVCPVQAIVIKKRVSDKTVEAKKPAPAPKKK